MFIPKRKLFALIFSIVINIIQAQTGNDKSFEITAFNARPDNDNEWIDWSGLDFKKVDVNEYELEGDLIINRDIDNEQKFIAQVFSYDAETKEKGKVMYTMENDFCDLIANDQDFYPDLREVSNLPSPDTCPFPKDTYKINKYLINIKPPKFIPKGDYLMEINIQNNEEIVSGYELYLNVQ